MGANIWIDQLDVPVGKNWDQFTEEALENCRFFLVVLSPNSVTSKNVLDELAFALDEDKEILPILYQTCKVPLRARRIQYSDFTGSYKDGFEDLLNALTSAHPAIPLTKTRSENPIIKDTENSKNAGGTKSLIAPLPKSKAKQQEYCRNCGKTIHKDNSICPHCGLFRWGQIFQGILGSAFLAMLAFIWANNIETNWLNKVVFWIGIILLLLGPLILLLEFIDSIKIRRRLEKEKSASKVTEPKKL